LRGLKLPIQKSHHPKCFICHPHKILAKFFSQDNNRKYEDKTNMVPAKHKKYVSE